MCDVCEYVNLPGFQALTFVIFFFLILHHPPRSTLFPYTTLFRSIQLTKLGYDATPFNQILKQNAKREMRLRLGKVTVADVLEAQPVTTNLLKFMRASIKMIGVSNLQSFIASMTQKLTLSDISDESKNYLDKAGITTACLRIKSKWTAGGK